jgi:hypothetical protein
MTAAAIAMATQSASLAEDMVKLELEIPKPMFVGTPVPAKVANLEPPNTPAPTIMLPKDANVNVASEKKVTSSDSLPVIGELEMITDGDKEASDGSYVELGPGLQWVQIDLETVHEIYAVAFWHYHQQARIYHDVIVQVADDADFLENVRTLYNNDHDNSAGLGVGKDMAYVEVNTGRLIDAKGEKARFVRLYSRGSTAGEMNHYIEVEVFGRPAK